MFTENKVIGGVPCFTWTIQKWLPKNKRKRETVYRIQMFILTYITYSFFNMARRPIAVVKAKIIEECNSSKYSPILVGELRGLLVNLSNEWCEDAFFEATTEEFMGFLDCMYIGAYGLCLYVSGIIADCYNPRYYLTAGCVLSGLLCALLSLSDFWWIRSFKFFCMVYILFGASQSTGWPVALSCVTHWHRGGRRGMFFGFWNTHNYLGSILGIYIAASFVDTHWGWSFCIPGFILAFMGIAVYLCMVVDPDDLKELDKVKKQSSSRQLAETGLPQWLSASRSITMHDAWRLPGVIEFSACMFFSRMVGYIFLYWLAVFIQKANHVSSSLAAYYSIAYVLGGSLGGIVAGILVDIFRRSGIVCAIFLLSSIPVLILSHISELGKNIEVDFPLLMLMGLFVEAPYVITSTSVSADLGTHKMIKRNHRAISTVGGIIEGTGAIGAAVGCAFCSLVLIDKRWTYIIYLMIGLQFVATLCLSRQAYKDFLRKEDRSKKSSVIGIAL